MTLPLYSHSVSVLSFVPVCFSTHCWLERRIYRLLHATECVNMQQQASEISRLKHRKNNNNKCILNDSNNSNVQQRGESQKSDSLCGIEKPTKTLHLRRRWKQLDRRKKCNHHLQCQGSARKLVVATTLLPICLTATTTFWPSVAGITRSTAVASFVSAFYLSVALTGII